MLNRWQKFGRIALASATYLVLALLVGTWWVGWQFVDQNQQLVSVHYVAGQAAEVALWKAILASFGLGAALVAVFALWTSARSGMPLTAISKSSIASDHRSIRSNTCPRFCRQRILSGACSTARLANGGDLSLGP